MAYSERRLPHFSVVGVPLFVTFRLHGSLPRGRSIRPDILTSNGEAFAAMDRLLDTARSGPCALHRPEVARMVAAAIRAGDTGFQRYQLHAYVVMRGEPGGVSMGQRREKRRRLKGGVSQDWLPHSMSWKPTYGPQRVGPALWRSFSVIISGLCSRSPKC